mmetsp:Transcript_6585/g.17056  ORF Transcript_6585/g.17056 Transcript_6585/m.17056 type:complete len:382 (+) Transcript_6585:531-1676(+)|eukprot:jgi/Tetstr1/430010/TSEL_019871.t1
MAPYLTERALQGLKQYQYKPGGYTWLDAVHNPYWNSATELLPRWLAPNLITLTGLLSLVIAYFLNAAYVPTLTGTGPWWIYFSSGFSMIFYTNLDCIDGKQARRTGTSSPLGQMFDHGCDALAVHLVLLNICCSIDAGMSWLTLTLVTAIKVPWLLAQWEEYHTGVMLYGNGYWGVLEINYGVALLHFISAAFGPDVWKTNLAGAVGLDIGQLGEFRGLVFLFVALGATIQSVGQLTRVFNGHHPCPPEEKGHKELCRLSQSVQILEKFLLGATALLWLENSPPSAARSILSTFGIVYAWEATHLIVAHMTKEPIVTTWWPTAMMAAAYLNTHVGALDAVLVPFVINAVVIVGYLHYVTCVVNEICAALGINCLTIRHTKP